MFFKLIFLLIASFTFTLGGDKHTIAKISEASGIDYCSNSNTLMVVDDEGVLYEISLDGKILNRENLGDYDLEGVVCHDKEVVLAVEEGILLILNRKTMKMKKYTLRFKKKKFKIGNNLGIEGLTFNDGLYYLSVQAKKKKDARLLLVTLRDDYAKIIDIIHHGVIDVAGLQYKDGILYMTSDKKNRLYLYDLSKRKIIRKYKLQKFNQEGITFDNKGMVYFADDGGTVKKFKLKDVLK